MPTEYKDNLILQQFKVIQDSKVISLGANRKPICDFILVINSNYTLIYYRFRDIHGEKNRKLLILPTPALFDAP